MNKVVIADASPLIAFSRINGLVLISGTLGKIIIPKAVSDECLSDMSQPGAVAIREAIKKKKISIHLNPDMH